MNSKIPPEQLRQRIREAREKYYREGKESGFTDETFDALEEELRKIDPEDPLLKQVGHPTQNENQPYTGSIWPKVKHQVPQGSLNKVKGVEGIKDWWEKTERSLRN